jgi:ornithine decarboxylase
MNVAVKILEADYNWTSETQLRHPGSVISHELGQKPLYCFCPEELKASYERFQRHFSGLVTYAVKANPSPVILRLLCEQGMRAFDVASIDEIALVRGLCPDAVCHYNNPIRSDWENEQAFRSFDVRSFAVDALGELMKLKTLVGTEAQNVEISVRFFLDLKSSDYDFGSKFGATASDAIEIARTAKKMGFKVSLTFHPGSQCRKATAYQSYIYAAKAIADAAGVSLERLNVGGGFPVQFPGQEIDPFIDFTSTITAAVTEAFGDEAPVLLCEPGRAMVASSVALLTRVKVIKRDGRVYLNDGIYGGLLEPSITNLLPHYEVFDGDGQRRDGDLFQYQVFGPTCDSLDVLPGKLALPADLREGDVVMFHDMGAYGSSTTTSFNGYSSEDYVLVDHLE